MADRPTTLRPTPDVLPADRLRNLIDRACRHLTPAEANALRGALAGTMRNATTAVEGLHQRAADAEDDRDRARRWAVHLENENRRLEDELAGSRATIDHMSAAMSWIAGHDRQGLDHLEEAQYEARARESAVEQARSWARRAERAEQQAAQVRALHRTTEGPFDTPYCEQCGYAAPCPTIRALDAAGQPDTPAGECGYVDGDRRCIGRPGHHNPRLVHGPWVTHTAQHAREDGHTGATGATSTTDAPGADDDANGPHAGTDGRDTYRAAFQHLLPESAWHLAGHLADAAAGLADQWTRALEQRNSRLRGELRQARAEVGQLRAKLRGALAGAGELREQRARLEAELRLARADLDHRDQTIRHLENGLRHERQALADARDYLNRVPAHHINSQVRADLNRRLDARP